MEKLSWKYGNIRENIESSLAEVINQISGIQEELSTGEFEFHKLSKYVCMPSNLDVMERDFLTVSQKTARFPYNPRRHYSCGSMYVVLCLANRK